MKPRRFAPTSGIVITDRGNALCGDVMNFACAAWQESFERLPLSVEMWAKPKIGKERLFTCVYPREIAAQIGVTAWGMTVGSGGDLAAFICGDKTRWIWNNQRNSGREMASLWPRDSMAKTSRFTSTEMNSSRMSCLIMNRLICRMRGCISAGLERSHGEAMIQEVRISQA